MYAEIVDGELQVEKLAEMDEKRAEVLYVDKPQQAKPVRGEKPEQAAKPCPHAEALKLHCHEKPEDGHVIERLHAEQTCQANADKGVVDTPMDRLS